MFATAPCRCTHKSAQAHANGNKQTNVTRNVRAWAWHNNARELLRPRARVHLVRVSAQSVRCQTCPVGLTQNYRKTMSPSLCVIALSLSLSLSPSLSLSCRSLNADETERMRLVTPSLPHSRNSPPDIQSSASTRRDFMQN